MATNMDQFIEDLRTIDPEVRVYPGLYLDTPMAVCYHSSWDKAVVYVVDDECEKVYHGRITAAEFEAMEVLGSFIIDGQ